VVLKAIKVDAYGNRINLESTLFHYVAILVDVYHVLVQQKEIYGAMGKT
jgi:hypothetical protein